MGWLSVGAMPAVAGLCPNSQYRVGYGAYLPDCRAYEQATPVDKGGGAPNIFFGSTEAAEDGDAVTFFNVSGGPGGVGEQSPPIFLASRGSDGWSTQGLLPSASDGNEALILGWSPDLSDVFAQAASTKREFELLALNPATGSQTTIVPTPTKNVEYAVDGTSADGSVLAFEESGEALTADANTQQNVYAWDQDTDALALVDVLPDGTVPAGGGVGGPYGWMDQNLTGGGALSGYMTEAENVVSEDGSAVFFTAAADTGRDAGVDQVFLRENPFGTASPSCVSGDACTVQVSASQKTNGTGTGGADPNGPQPAAFMDATPDGSEALFTSPEELTNDANTGSADQGNDLYEYDAQTGVLTDLSLPDPGVTNADANGAEVQGVLGMSDDGSYVYFAANGVLAPGASQGSCEASPVTGLSNSPTGTCNLYLWHDGSVTYIATLNVNAPVEGTQNDQGLYPDYSQAVGYSDAANWEAADPGGASVPTARVTPDGETLLFSSQEPLTGYDNDGYSEMYRYSAAGGQLQCVSCDPSGAAPTGNATYTMDPASPVVPDPAGVGLVRNLSDSGDQVFFESPDPLLPQDTNGMMNVYEWEADGAGSCTSAAQDGGCLYSLSSGQGPDPALLDDASASGNDVFFLTTQQLVGQDQDQIYDIYDARVGGGLASQWPATASPCSSAAECHPSSSPPPASVSVGTVTFSGPGNTTSAATTTATPAKVKVTKKAVKGEAFTLTVKVPAKGKLTVTGADVKKLSRSASKAGSYKLTLRLTAQAKTRLKRKRKLTVAVKVAYRPASGKSSSVPVSVELKA